MKKEDNNMVPITSELYEELMIKAMDDMIFGKDEEKRIKGNIEGYIENLKKFKKSLKILQIKKKKIKEEIKQTRIEIRNYKKILRQEKLKLQKNSVELSITSNDITVLNKKYIIDDYIEAPVNNQKVIK